MLRTWLRIQFERLERHNLLNFVPDKLYLKVKFYLILGRKLNLKSPVTYNEKLQWLKLYDKNLLYPQLVDKYEVRKYIAGTIGKKHLIPLIGVWDKFDEIDFSNLPNQFVLKCTHDCGSIVICKDKSKFDVEKARKKINECLKRNYYYHGREWVYKNLKPRIICEKYMIDEPLAELRDYKFFCFHGTPRMLFVATDRENHARFDFYDMKFNHLPLTQIHYENGVKKIIKPKSFDEMTALASKLSKNIPHVRVDLYDVNGNVYFGELTFFHCSGFTELEPEKYDEILGSWLNLNQLEV